MTKLHSRDSFCSRADNSRQYLLLIVASFLLVSPVEASDSIDSSQMEVALNALVDAEYPTYVRAIEAYNETFGKMRRGRLQLAEKSKFQDSMISFDGEVLTDLKNTTIYQFTITTIFNSEGGRGVSVFLQEDAVLMQRRGIQLDQKEDYNFRSRVLEVVSFLNLLLKNEDSREFSPNELLAILTSVISLEDSELEIIYAWDDAFYYDYWQNSTAFNSILIKQNYLRKIRSIVNPLLNDIAGCFKSLDVVPPYHFQVDNNQYFKLLVYVYDGYLYELLVGHDGSSYRVEQLKQCIKLPISGNGF